VRLHFCWRREELVRRLAADCRIQALNRTACLWSGDVLFRTLHISKAHISATESTLKHTHKYIMPSYNYTGTKPKKTAYFADGSTKVYSQNKGNGNMHAAGQKAIKEKGSGKSLGNIPKKDRTKVK
jgi:hypothetical protein